MRWSGRPRKLAFGCMAAGFGGSVDIDGVSPRQAVAGDQSRDRWGSIIQAPSRQDALERAAKIAVACRCASGFETSRAGSVAGEPFRPLASRDDAMVLECAGVVGQPRQRLRLRHGARQEVTLDFVAAVAAQEVELFLRLDPLGDRNSPTKADAH